MHFGRLDGKKTVIIRSGIILACAILFILTFIFAIVTNHAAITSISLVIAFASGVVLYLTANIQPNWKEQLGLCIASAIFLACAIVQSVLPSFCQDRTITLQVLEKSNEKSIVSAASINEIYLNGDIVDLSEYVNDDWLLTDDVFIGITTGAPLIFKTPHYQSMEIVFSVSEWNSGISISSDNYKQEVNLYSDELSTYRFSLPDNLAQVNSDVLFCFWLLLFTMIYNMLLLLDPLFEYIKKPRLAAILPSIVLVVGAIWIIWDIDDTSTFILRLMGGLEWVYAALLLLATILIILISSKHLSIKTMLPVVLVSVLIALYLLPVFAIREPLTHVCIQVAHNEASSSSTLPLYISLNPLDPSAVTAPSYTGWEADGIFLVTEGNGGEEITFDATPGNKLQFYAKHDLSGRTLRIETNGFLHKTVKLSKTVINDFWISFTVPKGAIILLPGVIICLCLFSLCYLFLHSLYLPLLKRLITFSRTIKIPTATPFIDKFFCGTISTLPPLVFIYFLYQNNLKYLSFLQVNILAIISIFLSLLLFYCLTRLFRNYYGSALIIFTLSIIFFTFNQIYNSFINVLSIELFFVMVLLLLGPILILLNFVGKKLHVSAIYQTVALGLSILLLFNFVPSVQYNLAISQNESAKSKSFFVDQTTSSPNIYWFHTDGMISFDAVSYFFGDSQNDFKTALSERGFLINESAMFEGLHSTKTAVPLLFNPDINDEYFLPFLDNYTIDDKKSYSEHENYLWNLIKPGYDTVSQSRSNLELLAAFEEKGYISAIIAPDLANYRMISTYFYQIDEPDTPKVYSSGGHLSNITSIISELESLKDLLLSATILAVIQDFIDNAFTELSSSMYEKHPLDFYEGKSAEIIGNSDDLRGASMIDSLYDFIQLDRPQIAIIQDMQPHFPYVYDANGQYWGAVTMMDGLHYDRYMAQHQFSTNTLIGMIDMVLEQDPDAVIVLQSDHGMHSANTNNLMLEDGYSVSEVKYIQNSTLSAVRIPETFGGLDEPLAPLNISRELVNRYVGAGNYSLLDREIIPWMDNISLGQK